MISDLIEAWLSMKALETARSYRSVIKDWFRFLGSKKDKQILGVNREQIVGYVRELKSKTGEVARNDKSYISLSNATINKKLVVLRGLYQMLHDEGLVERNPWKSSLITPPKTKNKMKRKTEALTVEEVKKLFSLINFQTRSGVRDYALMSICLGAGLRMGEALRLRLDDIMIDKEGGFCYLKIREPKNGYDHTQGLPDWAQEALSMLVSQRMTDTDAPNSTLFVRYNSKGKATKPLLFRTAARLMNKYYKLAGIKNKSTHSLRKTAIQQLARVEASIINIRDFARHKSVTTTEHYLDEIRKISTIKKVVY